MREKNIMEMKGEFYFAGFNDRIIIFSLRLIAIQSILYRQQECKPQYNTELSRRKACLIAPAIKYL